MYKHAILFIVFFCFFFVFKVENLSQNEFSIDDSLKTQAIKKILNEFRSKENLKEKINYLYYLDEVRLGWIQPLIKDTLEELKKRIYQKTLNPEARFKLNIIESKVAIQNNNLPHAIYLLENNLNFYSISKSDSELVVSKLIELFNLTMNVHKLIHYNIIYKNYISKNKNFLIKESEIYSKLGEYQKAIQHKYKESIEIPKTDTFQLYHLHNALGLFFSKLKNYDSSLFHFTRARDLSEYYLKSHKDDKTFTFLFNLAGGNLGFLHYNAGNYSVAIPLLEKDFYHSIKSGEWFSAFNASSLLALCYAHSNKMKMAEKRLDTSRKLLNSKLHFNSIARKSFYKTLSDYYFLRKDYQKAYINLVKYIGLSDSINEKQRGTQTLYESLNYEIKLKSEELEKQNKFLALSKENEIKSRNIRSYGIFVFAILIVMIFYMFRINFKLRKREQELEFKNLKIQTQNITIQNSLKEKDLLIKEVHHRVKNNLQLIISIINLQKSKGVNAETQSILDDLKFRIFSISNAHQMLYQRNSIQSVNIKEYLISILKNLESTSERPILINYNFENSDDIYMGLDYAILLGLLINEMFTNSLKYAVSANKDTEINLHFYKDPYRDLFKMTYSDNGPGLSDTFENIIRKNQSTGLELIYMLVQNLSGKLNVNSGKGLEYTIEFEIQSKHSEVS